MTDTQIIAAGIAMICLFVLALIGLRAWCEHKYRQWREADPHESTDDCRN